MDSTGSMLRTVLTRVRFYLDEPDVDAKYTDAYIVDQLISTATTDVIARLHLTTGCEVVLKFPIELDPDIEFYPLPPCVQEVVQITQVDASGNYICDLPPVDRMVTRGGWQLQGAPGALELTMQGEFTQDLSIHVHYISNGDVRPHLGTGALEEDADGDHVLTLDTTPTLGTLDRRPGAYAGQVLRILPSTPGPIEERLIVASTFDGTDYLVQPRRNFDHAGPVTAATTTSDSDSETVTYEIAPAGSAALYEAVALLCAMKLGTSRKITSEHMVRLQTLYKGALKTYGDNLTNIQTRRGQHYVKDTLDNPLTTRII